MEPCPPGPHSYDSNNEGERAMVEGTTVGKNPEEIRQEIEGTRASLDEKIHNLESNVHDAVHAAKEKLSPSHYVEANPWACFGAAVGVGFLLGQLTVGAS